MESFIARPFLAQPWKVDLTTKEITRVFDKGEHKITKENQFVALSSDEKYLAYYESTSLQPDVDLTIVNVETGKVVTWKTPNNFASLWSAIFSPDNSKLMVTYYCEEADPTSYKNVAIIDTATGEQISAEKSEWISKDGEYWLDNDTYAFSVFNDSDYNVADGLFIRKIGEKSSARISNLSVFSFFGNALYISKETI